MISLLSYCFFFKTHFFLASCGLDPPSYLWTNKVWYVSLLQLLSMYSSAYTTFQTLSKRNTYWTLRVQDHTSSPSLFVQILLSAISLDLFISVCSYIPISYHLSLLFFILCSSFFFALPFFSSVLLSQTTIAETCFLYFSHNHKRLFLLFLFQRNHLLYTLIFFSNFSLIT